MVVNLLMNITDISMPSPETADIGNIDQPGTMRMHVNELALQREVAQDVI
jgi:hypothetical protein